MDLKNMINKFSLAQMTSNESGKTSASGTMGCIICTAAAIAFLWGAFTKQSELVNQAVAYTALGVGILGYRKSKDLQEAPKEEAESPKEEIKPE